MSQVHWFPHYRDKFVISGSDIGLYEVEERENVLNDSEIETIKLQSELNVDKKLKIIFLGIP